MKRPIRVLAFVLFGGFALSFLFVILVWALFIPEEVELTGLSFDLSEATFFDESGMRGEGHRVWIYRIPEDIAQRLGSADYPMSEYPMASALAFDGYKRIRWIRLTGTESNEVKTVLRSAMQNELSDALTLDDIATIGDARKFAHDLATRHGAYIAGRYTLDGDFLTNYIIYVMSLEQRILIKLSLLT